MTAVQEEFTVEFGPLEQRGVFLGISASSLSALAVGTTAGLVLLLGVGGGVGLLAAVAVLVGGLAFALVPVHGTPLVEWALLLIGYVRRAATGRARWRSTAPTAGQRADGSPVETRALPEPLRRAGTRVVAVPHVDREVGVIIDGSLAIGVLQARAGSAFLMKQPEEQVAATGEWADVIGSIADSGSPWVRVQWRDASAPVDTGELARFVADAACPAARRQGTPENAARTVYERLVRTQAPAAETHDVLIAVAMDPRRVARQVKDAGGGDLGLGRTLLRHLEQFAYKLAAGDVLVDGMLSARQVARVLREHADPAERRWQSDVTAAGETDMAGVDPSNPWPLATDEGFSALRTDGAWHATLWVKEWPRRQARVDFLAPLLLRTGSVTRTVSVTMAPVDAVAALRAAEDAATSDESDEALRGRFGIRTSGKRRREAAAAGRREEELLDGYDDVRFSGYVTVSASSEAALEDAVHEVMTQARAARLRLVRLVGQQPEAFWFTAPLCRGVR